MAELWEMWILGMWGTLKWLTAIMGSLTVIVGFGLGLFVLVKTAISGFFRFRNWIWKQPN